MANTLRESSRFQDLTKVHVILNDVHKPTRLSKSERRQQHMIFDLEVAILLHTYMFNTNRLNSLGFDDLRNMLSYFHDG